MATIIILLTLLLIAIIIWWSRTMAMKNARLRLNNLANIEADSVDTKTDEFADLFGAIDEKLNEENSEAILTTGEFPCQRPTENGSQPCHQRSSDTAKTIDTDRLIMLFEDKNMVNELIHDFINSHQQDMALLEQSIKQGNLTEMRSIAHRMKGVARTMECDQLADLLEQIEKAIREEKLTSDAYSIKTIQALTQQMLTEHHHERL
ncbi:Hpt domain-containing protein [Photobacterium sagamiensis]|uniref:Hpt domain-containing protein n=1 Tax=Photobacterium sagamiensis TaxID=2910241 RepID=UPI003D099B07